MKPGRMYRLALIVGVLVLVVVFAVARAAPLPVIGSLVVGGLSALILARAGIMVAARQGSRLRVASYAVQGAAGCGLGFVMGQWPRALGWSIAFLLMFFVGTQMLARAIANEKRDKTASVA